MQNEKYYNNPFVQSILSVYQENDIQQDMSKLGLLTDADQAGRIYPVTKSANTVLDILMINLQSLYIMQQFLTTSKNIPVKDLECFYFLSKNNINP